MNSSIQKKSSVILLFFIISIFIICRLSFLDMPLERDEGEYAYSAQMILEGHLPYSRVYNMKMPGIYFVYSLFLLFGESVMSIRLGLVFFNSLTILLMFHIGKKWFDELTGYLSALFYGCLSLLPVFDGGYANSEHFVIFFMLFGVFLLLKTKYNQNNVFNFFTGAFFGIAMIIKQPGFMFVSFALVFLIYRLFFSKEKKRFCPALTTLIYFLGGVSFPYLVISFVFSTAGLFERFWFWTFSYAKTYGSIMPVSQGIFLLKSRLIDICGNCTWLIFLIPFAILSFFKADEKENYVWLVILSFLASVSVSFGLYFRSHYFIYLLPSFAFLSALGVREIVRVYKNSNTLLQRFLVCFFMLGLTPFFIKQSLSWKHYLKTNHFWNSFKIIAKQIENNSGPDDKIAILGSEPEIFFYSKRKSSTGYIYSYPLFEPHPFALTMQNEMINEIIQNPPLFLIKVFSQPGLGVGEYSEKKIFFWFEQYKNRCYEPFGLVQYFSNDKIEFRFKDSLTTLNPSSEEWVAIYKRRSKQMA